MGDALLRVQDVAERLGVSVRTMENLIKAGRVPAFVRIGRQRRWRPEDIERFLECQLNNHISKPQEVNMETG